MISQERRKEILQVFQRYATVVVQQNNSNCNNKSHKDDDDEDYNEDTPTICISDTKKALKRLGMEGIKQDEISSYFDFDRDDSCLDSDQFLRFAAVKSIQQDKSKRAFQLIDEAHKGIVVVEDLQRVATDLGEDFTQEELIEMIQFVDKSADGLLTPAHFFKIARKVNL